MDIFENCPVLENDNFTVRLIEENDTDDLLSVYSDKNALPFFNSDNCNGSNFYCASKEDMANSIKFWLIEYHENRGFVRFTIIDKKKSKAIGTIEMFKRQSDDYYNNCGLLRLDLKSDYEKSEIIYDILSLIIKPFYEWFECTVIATKAAVYAIERIDALKKMNFVKSDEPLVGFQKNTLYTDYWIIEKD